MEGKKLFRKAPGAAAIGLLALAGLHLFSESSAEPKGRTYTSAEMIDAVSDNTRHKDGTSEGKKADSHPTELVPNVSPVFRDKPLPLPPHERYFELGNPFYDKRDA